MINQVLAGKILFIAGITNIILVFLILLSCRCLSGKKIGNWLSKFSWHQNFFNLHCYFWWAFFISVIIHTSLAFYLFR